jgi:predicted ATPase
MNELFPPAESSVSLEYLRIYDLHGAHDLTLEFDGPYAIFIADNGTGKTKALFLLQALLRKDFSNILRINFAALEIKFSGVSPIRVKLQDLEERPNLVYLRRSLNRLQMSADEFTAFVDKIRDMTNEELRSYQPFLEFSRKARMPSQYFLDKIRATTPGEFPRDLFHNESTEDLRLLVNVIENKFKHHVIYLPTYRRVEQDIKSLFKISSVDNINQNIIHFGMRDVVERIAVTTKKIRDHFALSYSKISGQMLGQLAHSTDVSDEMKSILSNRQDVEIVLSRAGGNISYADRSLILNLWERGELTQNRHLSFFISNLIKSYEVVRDLDMTMQSFVSVCNGYLINKKLVYDTVNASIRLVRMHDEAPLELEMLSSGEKQILGVMSEIYLGAERSYAIIFDEPELSLSVEWQRKLLPDIARSSKCNLLVAATHSPFIFENDLDACARALKIQFRRQ